MDLPLSANFSEIEVNHWILDTSCDFASEIFLASAYYFCNIKDTKRKITSTGIQDTEEAGLINTDKKSSVENNDSELNALVTGSHHLVLDLYALDIQACYFYDLHKLDLDENKIDHTQRNEKYCHTNEKTSKNIQISSACMENYLKMYHCMKNSTKLQEKPVSYKKDEHSINILIPVEDNTEQLIQSFAVQIIFKTQKNGPSLTWTKDQDSRPCVFTSGHLLNNRSLMPCQDLPQSMSTWHCFLSVLPNSGCEYDSKQFTVLMTGEAEPSVTINESGCHVYEYYSSYLMPASTFALAVGTWSAHNVPECQQELETDRFGVPSLRLFASSVFQGSILQELKNYLDQCFVTLNSVLGPYPLHRLDVLIVPPGFDSLGMMCPHLMLLSQSVLPNFCGTEALVGGLLVRVAHELCHTWLGVLTGPRDWTEEWLTEGFCCYLEDLLHGRVCKWAESQKRERLELRCFLKYRTLKAEMDVTPKELQTLRPNGEVSPSHQYPSVVKNGLNSEKTFLQVHYLKGFFLLKRLESLCGQENFLNAIRLFLESNLGQLFSSKEFLIFCFEQLPQLSEHGLTVNQICEDWLDSPGMPSVLENYSVDPSNALYNTVEDTIAVLKRQCGAHKRPRRSAGSVETGTTAGSLPAIVEPEEGTLSLNTELLPEQKVLLLDRLVEDNVRLRLSQTSSLREWLQVQHAGAEVQHSWCELVILRRCLQWSGDVETFLTQHQAMGVYLYGELMISQNKRLQALAHRVYRKLRSSMAESPRQAVEEMLYPS